MKFQITFKDPDGVYESLKQAAEDAISNKEIETIDQQERDYLEESKFNTLKNFSDNWIRYSEYITIEFDTEKNTATVLKL